MTKHRAVVTGYDPTYSNPDGSTGRPKGVQTAADMRVATTYDVLKEGIFAPYGVPSVVGSPLNTIQITPFMAAIPSPKGGYYIVKITSNESVTLNLTNTGAVKVYVQQKDWEIANDTADANSEVVLGVVYGANPIPAGALLLFTSTLSGQTSTSGMTFTPAFKYTGALSGVIRVPTQADLANIAVIQAGMRGLVLTSGGGGTIGEYFYTGSAWQITTTANPTLESFISTGWLPAGQTFTFSSWNSTTNVGVISVPSDATTKYAVGQFIRIVQSTGGTKYGKILALTSTTLTVWLPSFTLVNEAITTPFYSGVSKPVGLPVGIAEGNPYAFAAREISGQSVSTNQTINFQTKDYDPLAMLSGGVFTAPVAGRYHFDVGVTLQTAQGNSVWLSYNKNNSPTMRGGRLDSVPGSIYNPTMSLDVSLNAGDTVAFGIAFTAGGSKPLEAGWNYFNGHLIGKI